MYVLHVLTYMSNLLVFAQETKKWNTNTKIETVTIMLAQLGPTCDSQHRTLVFGLSLMLSTMSMTLLFTDLYY